MVESKYIKRKEGDEGTYDRYAYYYLVISFIPSFSESGKQKIELGAIVSQKLYDKYKPGCAISIEYAVGDPRIVLLEEESSSLSSYITVIVAGRFGD